MRGANNIEAAVGGSGDVLPDDNFFAPWEGEGGKWEGVVFYARAGREEPKSALDLEISPVSANAASFIVHWLGKPLPSAKVTVATLPRAIALRTSRRLELAPRENLVAGFRFSAFGRKSPEEDIQFVGDQGACAAGDIKS